MKSILEFYTKLIEFVSKNIAFTLTATNIIFLLLILIIKDPFGFRVSSYEKADPFFAGSSSQITRIVLEKTKVSESRFELVKEGDDWNLVTKGKKFPSDKERIDSLLKSLLNARKYTIVSSSKDKANEYGFNEDEIKLEIFQNDASSGYFLVGSVSSDGTSSHVKWKDSDDIYLVEENLKATANRAEFTYFLNKRVTPVGLTSEEIIGITLKKVNNTYEIRKTNVWNLESPKKGEISNEDMNTTLSKLSSITSDDLVVDDSALTGVDPNAFELRVDFKSKEGIPKSYTLLSAGFDKKLNAYYVRRNNEPSVYKLSEYSIKSVLEFKPETLIKK